MAEYYFTFMQKQAFRNHYVEIVADDAGLARQAMAHHFGDKWAFQYSDPEDFNKQVLMFNLKKLARISVIDHGSSFQYVMGDLNG